VGSVFLLDLLHETSEDAISQCSVKVCNVDRVVLRRVLVEPRAQLAGCVRVVLHSRALEPTDDPADPDRRLSDPDVLSSRIFVYRVARFRARLIRSLLRGSRKTRRKARGGGGRRRHRLGVLFSATRPQQRLISVRWTELRSGVHLGRGGGDWKFPGEGRPGLLFRSG
jgi:hypothetical protein